MENISKEQVVGEKIMINQGLALPYFQTNPCLQGMACDESSAASNAWDIQPIHALQFLYKILFTTDLS